MVTQAVPIDAVVEMAEVITENCIPIIPCLPGRKVPVKKPRVDESDLAIHVLDDPHEVGDQLRTLADDQGGRLNLGMMVGRQKDSPIAAVGLDTYKPNGEQAHSWARSMGISSRDPVWIIRTGRGGLSVVFHQLDRLELSRHIEPNGLPVDLLVNGFQIIPPSDTSREPDGGGSYTWMPGHSPIDIDSTDLMELPSSLVAFWQELDSKPTAPSDETANDQEKAWHLIKLPISEKRNVTLTRISGWLRLYHPAPVVLELLLAINDARCSPPLPEEEVRGIACRVCRYAQPGVNGHPQAIVNPWRDANVGA